MNNLFRILPKQHQQISKEYDITINKNTNNIKENNNKNNNINDSINDIVNNDNQIKKDNLHYWEYGNSGIKVKDFNKKMCNNLAILYYIDKVFYDYGILNKSYSKLYNSENTFTSEYGDIISNNNTVNIKLNKSKLVGYYNILHTGFTTISDININEKDIKKFRIPSFDSVINHISNIEHILKINRIFDIKNKFNITNNSSSDNFSFDIFINQIFDIIKKYNDNNTTKNLLKSRSNTAFYIKIYENHGKAFVIDDSNKLIYYITQNSNNNNTILYIRYYILKIDKNYKIIKN